jgi:hypothetical protein
MSRPSYPGDASPKSIDGHVPDQIADQSPVVKCSHAARPRPTPGGLHRLTRYGGILNARWQFGQRNSVSLMSSREEVGSFGQEIIVKRYELN